MRFLAPPEIMPVLSKARAQTGKDPIVDSAHLCTAVAVASVLAATAYAYAADRPPLPGTKPLTWTGDIASRMVDGVDKFLLRQLDRSVRRRAAHWRRDPSSPAAYDRSIEPNRKRLAHILGLRGARVAFEAPEIVSPVGQAQAVARAEAHDVYAVRWPVFGDVHGEGLLLEPRGRPPLASVVALPDARQSPEHLAGLVGRPTDVMPFARRLADSGCRVVVPAIINRSARMRGLTNREYLYRSAFELGRHLIGYEVQKILACVDWFSRDANVPVGVIGWGEGGLLALYAAAADGRIDAACVSGYFDSRRNIWNEPLDRNVFGLLEQFGDAELASMIAPRSLIVEAARAPEATIPGGRGAPARVVTPKLRTVRAELARARKLAAGLRPAPTMKLVVSGDGTGPAGTDRALQALIGALRKGAKLAGPGAAPERLRPLADPAARHKRQLDELDRHNQRLLAESSYVRAEFMKKLDTSSPARFAASARWYRRFFRDEVIGHFDADLLPANPRSRLAYDRPKWTGYEVVLDVWPDVFAYGILLMPKAIAPGRKRPVVVCQHGLEGRPQHVIGKEKHAAYKAFAAKLAERGFITFAPQNLYIFGDRFRTLQRKANPLKKTLFSVMVPQHRQITDWLKTLPQVDGRRIAFYGLSYGGKSAMRIPPLVSNYCLSICSADFNEWVWKNASSRSRYSYVRTGEYEIFEFDLGSTFNYAEMAALIAPRPFMVERGHFDGVAPDETVAHEFAKVRHLYAARLGLADRCAIEWFVGPHTIHGKGTFDFLHKHLNWPAP